MPNTQRKWLITGCSTGLGRSLAEVLIARGETVFATARQPEQLADLVSGHENAHALKLDVTLPADIAAVAAEVERHGGVDVLVNNAGYGYIAAIEEGEEDVYRDLFETNVFGLIAMTQAVLPAMRKQGSGHIFNVASVGGLTGNPGSGFYAGTKFAVVGLSESLSREVAHLGIKVTVIEPGPFRTDWAGRSLKTASKPIEAYAATVHSRARDLAKISGHQPGDPVRAAAAIITAADADNPPLNLVLGAPGLSIARQKIASMGREFDAWEAVSLSADYPDKA